MAGTIIWNPKEFAEKGEEIYRQNFQKDFEAQYRGQIVAIDVATGQAYRGSSLTEAYQEASKASKGPFHFIKVGARGVYKYSNLINGDRDWIFR